MFSQLKNIHTRWLIRSLKKNCPPQPAGWDAVNRLALILNDRSQVNKSGIDRFVEETGKYVEVFYVETGARQPTFGDWKCLTRKHRSVLHTPTREVLGDVGNRRYDVVINAATDRYSAVLAAAINAPIKCGCSREFREADLVIEATNGLGDYLSQTLRYLQMIRPQTL